VRPCGPEGEAPRVDPLGTAGADRSTGPVHIGLNKQQQVRQGEQAQRRHLVVRKELERPTCKTHMSVWDHVDYKSGKKTSFTVVMVKDASSPL
jgi:hypothetical protein